MNLNSRIKVDILIKLFNFELRGLEIIRKILTHIKYKRRTSNEKNIYISHFVEGIILCSLMAVTLQAVYIYIGWRQGISVRRRN
jgi:hypothetical protein